MSLPKTTSQPCRWEALTNVGDVYTPRTGHALVNDDGVFHLFGGTDGSARQSDVHSYNVETNVWQGVQATGRVPPARSGAQTVLWNGVVWFFGGYTKKDGDYFNDLYKYEIATSTWGSVHTLGETPNKRTDHSVVLFRDSMLLFGGFDGRNRFNDLRELHLRERRWSHVSSVRSSVPRSRFGHTAVIYGNSMFSFGGWDGHDTLQELLEFNLSSNMWVSLPPTGSPPRARYRHTAVVCGDAMFTFGGVDKTQYRFPDLHEYNFSAKAWLQVNTTSIIPSARTFHKTVVHGGYMYVMGGYDGRRLNDAHRILLRSREELQRVQARTQAQSSNQRGGNNMQGAIGDAQEKGCNHMPEDLWTWQQVELQRGQVYTPRTGHAVVVWNHSFYLMGGTDENARQNDIYRYDLRNSTWHCVEPVTGFAPSARSGSKAVVSRDSIFYFGGYTKKDGDYFNDLFEFNIPTSHWSKIELKFSPSNRTDHSCVACECSLYIFGGFDGKSRFQDLHQYNIDAREWIEIPSADNGPSGRFGHSAVVYRESMYVFGGWNGHDTLDDLYEFSITTNQWYSVPGRGDIPPSRYRHSAVVHGCCMFVFGGVDKRQARFADLCEFSFETRRWSTVRTQGDSPTARTFHRAVMYAGSMYILGGFDGARRNDMYKIALPEQQPRCERDTARRRRQSAQGSGEEAAAEPGLDIIGADMGAESSGGNVDRLRRQVLELQRRLEGELERHLCKVCFEREINTIILDCNHRAVCQRCLEQLQSCPCCRAPITKVVQTYDA